MLSASNARHAASWLARILAFEIKDCRRKYLVECANDFAKNDNAQDFTRAVAFPAAVAFRRRCAFIHTITLLSKILHRTRMIMRTSPIPEIAAGREMSS